MPTITPEMCGEPCTAEDALTILRSWRDEGAIGTACWHLTLGAGLSLHVGAIDISDDGTVWFSDSARTASIFAMLRPETNCYFQRLSNGEQGKYEMSLWIELDGGRGMIQARRFRPVLGGEARHLIQ